MNSLTMTNDELDELFADDPLFGWPSREGRASVLLGVTVVAPPTTVQPIETDLTKIQSLNTMKTIEEIEDDPYCSGYLILGR